MREKRAEPAARRGRGTRRAVGLLVGAGLLAGCSAAAPIHVERIERSCADGPIRGFVARVDVSNPRVGVVATGRASGTDLPPGAEARLVGTDRWAMEHGAALAVNANYFSKLDADTGPARYADIIGLSIDHGVVVSPARSFGGRADPALVISDDGRARILHASCDEPARVAAAVAGVGGSEADPLRGTLLVERGRSLADTARVEPEKRHPRTAAGVSRDGRTLWLLAIDGRQPEWSVGMTLPEVADLLISRGAYDAVNLDGGGSTAFVYRPGEDQPLVMNRPSDGGFRAVANHLGFVLRDGPAAIPASTASAQAKQRE